MKSTKIFLTVFLVYGLVSFAKINAQEKSSIRRTACTFEFKHVAKNDTIHTLYCAIAASDLSNFEKVYLSYNDKTKTYFTKSLSKNKSEEYIVEGKFIFFRISENLVEPFVIIEGMDKLGNKFDINERNAMGKVINSKYEKARWKRSVARIDSMDFVRQFDGVYIGSDGMPRYTDKNGTVYIIEKDYTHHE
jgi:hypothetical protein